MSHPSWVRGLKPDTADTSSMQGVAPLVGAWIETTLASCASSRDVVAPLVGAWIETYRIALLLQCLSVAPLVGAWIETWWNCCSAHNWLSHPSWVRGLKLCPVCVIMLIRCRTPRGCVD